MRMLPRFLAALIAATLGVTLLPDRAAAYTEPYVSSFKAATTRVSVASNSCRQVGYRADFGGGDGMEWLYVGATTEVWKGVSNVGNDSFYDEITGTMRASSYYYWCPSLDGLGTFRLRLTQGEFSGWSVDDAVEGSFATGQTASFTVKQAAKVINLRAQRSGARRSLTAKAMFYSISRSQWSVFPRGTTVVLQRRSVGGSVWANVKTITVGRSGGISTSWTANRIRDYRIVTRTTTNTWNGVSVVVRR